MVFPSSRCLTCKTRRVKCDASRPTCSRCLKGNRSCTWESNDETNTPFRSENAFAQGQPRRPRRLPAGENQEYQSMYAVPPSRIESTLCSDIESHAFNYYVANYTRWPKGLVETGYEYGAYALCNWDCALPGSSLRLAFSALSLAIFGRANHLEQALEAAERSYVKSIHIVRNDIKTLSNETIDQLLVTTGLMGSYETFTSKVRRRNPRSPTMAHSTVEFWESNYHLKGTAGLLQVRKQQEYPQNLPLEKALRRAIIRTCILRRVNVDEWLHDGSLYGEKGSRLKLDSLIISAASFLSRLTTLFPVRSPDFLIPIEEISSLATEAQDLDLRFSVWPQEIPREWGFSVHTAEGLDNTQPNLIIHGNSVHRYTSLSHAVTWNIYRTVRLLVNSKRVQLLSALANSSPQRPSIDKQLDICNNNIASLTTDLCYSVPVFLKTHSAVEAELVRDTKHICSKATCHESEIDPRMAAIIAWPLTVVLKSAAIPIFQKELLQGWLKTIANVLGADVLHFVAKKGDLAVNGTKTSH